MPLPEKSNAQALSWLDWPDLKCQLRWIYEGRMSPATVIQNGLMHGQSAIFIQSGELEVSTERGKITVQPNHWVFLKEGVRHQHFSFDASLLSLRFNWTWPGRQPLFDWEADLIIPSEKAPRLFKEAKKLEQLVQRRFSQSGRELPRSFCNVSTYLLVQRQFMLWLELYAEVLLMEGHVPSRFEIVDLRILKAVRLLDHHPFHQPFSEKELAARVNLSETHFGRLFARQFGITPYRYFERRRIEEAVSRVRMSSALLKEIAFDLGFASLSHFSSWFHRKTSISPSDLRESAGTGKGEF